MIALEKCIVLFLEVYKRVVKLEGTVSDNSISEVQSKYYIHMLVELKGKDLVLSDNRSFAFGI